MMVTAANIDPFRRSTVVSWDRKTAFRRFTREFERWWPVKTHSVGGKKVRRVVFEENIGGRIYEELRDGRRFQWGRVVAWEPPNRVAFTWHPGRDESEAQDVTVEFTDDDGRTRLELVSTGWERLESPGNSARRGYDVAWGSVLDAFAARKSLTLITFGLIVGAATLFLKMSGRLERNIDAAKGRMPTEG
jgi:uncharacterized protein YndB with AHSA1/START domain